MEWKGDSSFSDIRGKKGKRVIEMLRKFEVQRQQDGVAHIEHLFPQIIKQYHYRKQSW